MRARATELHGRMVLEPRALRMRVAVCMDLSEARLHRPLPRQNARGPGKESMYEPCS